jgi:hypothetical protein
MKEEHAGNPSQINSDAAATEDNAVKSTVELSEQDLEKVAGGLSKDYADALACKKVLDGKTDRRSVS